MLPRVIIHNGVSVDGRMDWFDGDLGLYYGLAGQLGAEAIVLCSMATPAEYLDYLGQHGFDFIQVGEQKEEVISLRLNHVEEVEIGILWLRYEVIK